jgi:outer membrane receptor protein involved in Fe transport
MSQLLSFLVLSLICFQAYAQSGLANGSIRGVVLDPSSSAVSGASVAARGVNTGFERRAVTNADGRFELPLLPLGVYEVTITAKGFAVYRQTRVSVELDKASDLNVGLVLEGTQQTVTVEADASILTTNSVSITGGLNQKAFENAPVTSRNSFNLALFAPGLNGRRDDEFGNPSFAFGGMQRRAFLVDGLESTQRGGPGRLGIFSPEQIEQIKVVHSAMSAEYGRTTGGIISLVTRGGSNDWHGSALTLLRRPGFIARPSLAANKAFAQWATYAGTLSGPIKKDKVFFFASGEYEPLDAPRAITISQANATALNLPATELGNAPFGQRFQTYLGRVDFNINERNTVFIRYNNFYTPSKFNTSGGLTARSAGNNFTDRMDTLGSQWTRILGDRAVNELRIGGIQREFTRPPVNGAVGPVIAITGVATLGSNDSANQYYKEQQWTFVDNLSYRWNRHELKAGADISTIEVVQIDRLALNFQFANLQQYLNTVNRVNNPATNRPFNFTQLTQDFGDNSASHRTGSYNFFLQDDYRVNQKLTLNLGVRYEYLGYPGQTLNNDGNNIAPRFGFAWQPNQKTVVRGGYGLFHDTLNLRNLSAALRQNGTRVQRYVINGTDAAAPQFPNPFANPPGAQFSVRPSITQFAADYKSMYSHQANVQVEREVLRDLSLTVGLQYYGGRKMPVLIDNNLSRPTSFLADGRPVFVQAQRPDARFNQVLQFQSIANSTYYGGFVAANKRFSGSFQLSASYTLGWAFNANDSVGDNGSNVMDSSNPRRDYGFSSSDQRHRFVFAAVWQWKGWMVSPNFTATSDFPVNVVAGSDLNGDSVNNDRPLFRGRNDIRGYGFKELNLRLSKQVPLWKERLKLELIAEAENLLNSTNPACGAGGCTGAVVNRFGAPDFLRVTSATNSRQIQLGGRLRF